MNQSGKIIFQIPHFTVVKPWVLNAVCPNVNTKRTINMQEAFVFSLSFNVPLFATLSINIHCLNFLHEYVIGKIVVPHFCSCHNKVKDFLIIVILSVFLL